MLWKKKKVVRRFESNWLVWFVSYMKPWLFIKSRALMGGFDTFYSGCVESLIIVYLDIPSYTVALTGYNRHSDDVISRQAVL